MNRRPLTLLAVLLGLGLTLLLLKLPGAVEKGHKLDPMPPDATSSTLTRAQRAAGPPPRAPTLEGGLVGSKRTEALEDTVEQVPEEKGSCTGTLTFELPPDATKEERESLIGRTVQLTDKYDLYTEQGGYEHWNVRIQPDLTAHVSGLWGSDYALRQALPMDPVSGSSTMSLAPFVSAGPVEIDTNEDRPGEAHVPLVRGRSFAGTIVDESGRPRGGAIITLTRDFPEVLYAASEIIQSKSRADGTFEFHCLPKRITGLTMRSPDAPSRIIGGRRLRQLLSVSGPVTLSLPSPVQRRFRLRMPGGRPASGFPLNVWQLGVSGGDWTRLQTDDAGVAVIDQCAPGDLLLDGVALAPEVLHPETLPSEPVVLSDKLLSYGSSSTPEGHTRWSIRKRLLSAELGSKDPVELTLVNVPILTGCLTGLSPTKKQRVTLYLIETARYEADLSPWEFGLRRTEFAEVRWDPGRASTLRSPGEAKRKDATNGTANFRIGCAAGNYVAVAASVDHLIVTSAVPVTISEDGADIVLTFPEPGRLEGVVQGSDGAPIPNATVRAFRMPEAPSWSAPGGSALSARTSADGRFELASLPPATYRMEVSADGWLLKGASELDVAEGSTTKWIPKLKPAGRLLVQLPDGAEFAECSVHLVGPEGVILEAESRQLSMEGSIVEFPSLPPGQVTASAKIGPNAKWHSGAAWITSGSTAEVQLLPAPGKRFIAEGFVYVDDQPARGYYVSLHDGQRSFESFVTDTRGHYLIDDLPAGTYSMQVNSPNYGSPVFGQQVEIRADVNSLRPIALEAGSIRGYFSESSTSYSYHGLEVALRRADAEADSNPFRVAGEPLTGEFLFQNVPPGRYCVFGLRDGREARDAHGPLVVPVTIDLLQGHSVEGIELEVRMRD